MKGFYYTQALLIAGVLLSCSEGENAATNQTASHQHQEWGYAGAVAPEHWAELSPENIKCIEGHHQSPIDILTFESDTFSGKIVFDYRPSRIDIVNNGHTIQAVLADSNMLRVDGHVYRMLQLHFHEPAEHHLDGIVFPMEVHFVHMDTAGNLAVVGIFVKEGPENEYLKMIWDDMPEYVNEHHMELAQLRLKEIFPADKRIYNYTGSLTTPPCTEGVSWFIIDQPILMSLQQIARFKSLYHGNNRPVQKHEQ